MEALRRAQGLCGAFAFGQGAGWHSAVKGTPLGCQQPEPLVLLMVALGALNSLSSDLNYVIVPNLLVSSCA